MHKFTENRPRCGAVVASSIAHGLPPEEGWTACIHHVDLWRDDVVKQRQKAADRFFRRGANVMEFRISVPCLAGFSGITPKRGDELFPRVLVITDPRIPKRKPDWADRWRFLAMGNPIRELRVTRRYPWHSRLGYIFPTDQGGSHWRMTFLNLWPGRSGGRQPL